METPYQAALPPAIENQLGWLLSVALISGSFVHPMTEGMN